MTERESLEDRIRSAVTTNPKVRVAVSRLRRAVSSVRKTSAAIKEDVVRGMCGDRLWFSLSQENRASLMVWPIAFINELRLRFDHLHTDPNLEFATMAPRVENNARPTWAAIAMRNIDALT